MSDPIRFEVMPNGACEVVVARLGQFNLDPFVLGKLAAPSAARITTERLPVERLMLAHQVLLVAFDPVERVLYVGEQEPHGWTARLIDRLDRRAEQTWALAARAVTLLKSRKPSKRRRGRKLVARIASER